MKQIALAFLLLIVSLTVAVYWDEITALVLAIAYIAVGLATATAVIIGFIGTWLLIEKVRTLRARRIEAEKQAHVLTITDNGQTWVRDTNPRAVYRNLTGTPALYVNGKQHQPAEWEMELYRYRLESMARLGSGRPTGPVVPGYATLLPPSPLNLLAELDTVQRCLIVGASDSGKTTLLQHIITRRLAISKVVVIDPHAYPGKWGGCIVVGTGRNYTEIDRALAALIQLMDKRYGEIGAGLVAEGAHSKLTIIIDEWRAIVKNLGKPAGEAMSALLTESRKAAFSVFVATHSEMVKAMGLDGESDLKDGFAIVRLSLVNGQRTATIDHGQGELAATVPGPYVEVRALAAGDDDFTLNLEPEPDPLEAEVLSRHEAGESLSAIARAVLGGDGGNQIAKIKAILAKFNRP